MTRLAKISGSLRFMTPRALIIEIAVLVLAVGLSVLGAAALLADTPAEFDVPSTTVSVTLVVPLLVAQLGRRRWPSSVCLLSTVLLLTIRFLEVPELQVSGVAWVISMFAAGRYGSAPGRDIVRALALVGVLALITFSIVHGLSEYEGFGYTRRAWILIGISQVLANLVLIVGAWIAGDIGHKRHARERELAARTLELGASREENARRAVMDERVRIAREIHDVVAHHVSVMGVQAGAARRALTVDPSRAEEPLHAIEYSSREAVQELHRLLGFLRRVDDIDPDGLSGDALAPRPSLERLPELRRQLADAGLAIRLTVAGNEISLPASVDLSAFRILQEALTNVLKYAGVDQADVELDYRHDSLVVSVQDRGRGPTGSAMPQPGGAGLLGIAERVALLGGTLWHGERDGGGFAVVAELPFAGHVTAAPSTLVSTADGALSGRSTR